MPGSNTDTVLPFLSDEQLQQFVEESVIELLDHSLFVLGLVQGKLWVFGELSCLLINVRDHDDELIVGVEKLISPSTHLDQVAASGDQRKAWVK